MYAVYIYPDENTLLHNRIYFSLYLIRIYSTKSMNNRDDLHVKKVECIKVTVGKKKIKDKEKSKSVWMDTVKDRRDLLILWVVMGLSLSLYSLRSCLLPTTSTPLLFLSHSTDLSFLHPVLLELLFHPFWLSLSLSFTTYDFPPSTTFPFLPLLSQIILLPLPTLLSLP